ncbi:hypothetical protein EDF18_0986 [Frigoribacterium sp. PhB107]|nr:hypothetical protein EDF18_0986 [Frigoribacterium sp. PhB107]
MARRAAASVTPVLWLIVIVVLILVYSPTLDAVD